MQAKDARESVAPTVARPRKRGFWRGLAAGVIAKLLLLAIIVLGMWLVRPFIWFAFTNAPYDHGKPIDPNSLEWLFLQLLGFVASIICGAAISRWSAPGSWLALAVYAALAFLLAFVVPFPPTESTIRTLIWVLEVPIGVLLGGMAYMRHELYVRDEA